MKKVLFMAAMAAAALAAHGEVATGWRMGARVTTGMSNVTGAGNKYEIGYGAVWIAEYGVHPNFYIQSGLGAENIAHKDGATDKTLNTFFLQLPVHFGGRVSVGGRSSLFLQAGPTFGYGIFGSKTKTADEKEKGYFDDAKRFDLGVGGRLGFEYRSFQVSVGANYGVLDAMRASGTHNAVFNLGVGYMF